MTIMLSMETENKKSCLIGEGLPSHFLWHHSQSFFLECNQWAEALALVDGRDWGSVCTTRPDCVLWQLHHAWLFSFCSSMVLQKPPLIEALILLVAAHTNLDEIKWKTFLIGLSISFFGLEF
jgi:hypothetical protein